MKAQRSRTVKSKISGTDSPGMNAASAGIEITDELIARLAYSYWEGRGGQGGSAEEDWARAEEELRRQAAPPPAVKVSAAG